MSITFQQFIEKLDEIYVLTPNKPKAKKPETKKPKPDKYGEDPEAYARRIRKKVSEGLGVHPSHPEYQQRLEKSKNDAEKKKITAQKERNSSLHQQRTRGKGIRAYSKGQSGWIKNGQFTPD